VYLGDISVKIQELHEQQLDEISLRQAMAAGMIGATALGLPKDLTHGAIPPSEQRHVVIPAQHLGGSKPPMPEAPLPPEQEQTVQLILKKYRGADEETIRRIVSAAYANQKPIFPRAHDILSIVGIESSFRPGAVSELRRDPARGLMQVRPAVWGLEPDPLHDIETNIKTGSDILSQYFKKLRDREKALHAYNIGITSVLNGETNPAYVEKFQREREQYKAI